MKLKTVIKNICLLLFDVCLHVCIRTMYMHCSRNQKKLDTLELESYIVVSVILMLGTKPRSWGKSSKFL